MPSASDNVAKLGRTIRRIRIQCGLSQEGLAGISGLDRTFMGQVERGEANPSFNVLNRIASGLNLTLLELIQEYESESNES